MKKMPTVILIPAVVIFLLLAGVFAYRVYTMQQASQVATGGEFPNSLDEGESKPVGFFSSLFGAKAPTPTPTPADTAGLSAELDTTVDDGGTSDLQEISQDAAGL